MLVDVTPYFENTTQQASYYDDELRGYFIAPVEGYVLHDKELDVPEIDENTYMETCNVVLGYTPGSISVGYNYDFGVNARGIYTITIEEYKKRIAEQESEVET